MQKWYKAVSLFNIISPTLNASPPALTKCINSFRKKILLVVRTTTHAPRGIRLHQNGTSFLPLLLWVVQTYGNHFGARSGEYGGWGRHSKCRSVIVAAVVRAVWGLALSCCKRTPDDSNPRRFDLIAGRRWFFRRSEYDALVTVVPLGM